jgi:hypothetical protein
LFQVEVLGTEGDLFNDEFGGSFEEPDPSTPDAIKVIAG